MSRPLLAALLSIALLGPGPSSAEVDDPVDGVVTQGSRDNMVEVVVSNPAEETAAGDVTFEVASAPSWMKVTATEADSEGELAAGASRTFTVVFDVADDAEVGSADDLVVSFTTAGALIDQPTARIRLQVGPREDEEEPAACPIDHEHAVPDWTGPEKYDVYVFRDHSSEAVERVLIFSGPVDATFDAAGGERFGPFTTLEEAQSKAREYCSDEADEEAGPGGPPVLRLAKIVSTFGDQAIGGSAVNSGSDFMSSFEELLSGKLGGAPRTIVAGTPISFDGSALRSVRYADGSLCSPGEQEPDGRVVRVGLKAGVKAEAHGTVGMHNYCGDNLIRSVSWNTGSRSYSGVNVFSDTAMVSITLTPTETVVDEDDPNVVDYRYRASVNTSNVLAEGEDQELVLIRQRYPTDADGHAVGEVPTGSGFSVSLSVPTIAVANAIGVTLVYEPMAVGEQPLDPPPYEHPEPFPPTSPTGRTDDDDDDDNDDDSGTGTGGTKPDEDGATDGTVDTGGGGGSDREDRRVDPGAVDPNSTDTSALIREWLGVAEPPENAALGAELHYNEWGVKLGRTPGGIISGAPGRPDDVGARTSPEYVWSLRDRLDSVDHCTVGEYVVARLERSSIARCAGRYPRTVAVPGVRGMAEERAIDEIGRSGLETRSTVVGPPPSRDLANRVADQRPSSTSRLVPGAVVEIEIYGDYEETVVVMPDLIGKSETLAVAWLEDLGLRPAVRRAGPAPVAESAGDVAAQSRPPDTGLAPGDEVMLFVFGAPVPVVTPVPVVNPAPAITQATCDRSWPGTLLTRDPATGADNCLCPSGTAWSKVRNSCMSLGGTPPARTADCRHMPGTIRNPATGACTCPVGAWDPAQGRCVDTSTADREREIAQVSKNASCEKLYSDIILFRRNPAYREMAARTERQARDLGCDAGRIAEATGATGGGDGDDAPITPVTGPVETKDEGEARVSSRNVNICINDINSVLDDHYDLVVNGMYIGEVANPEGGSVCYGAILRGGANELLLRLVATRGKSTFLKISINNDEYTTTFGGSTNHAWSVVAP